MTPQRHEQIQRLFLAACELEPAARTAFLDLACHGDSDLRAEVESLLAFHNPATVLEEVPADPPGSGEADTAGMAEEAPARFLSGTVLGGRYRIVSLLGRGGMGEVYRADDLKLGRPVALKFIAPGRAHDAVWLTRFFNEARIALNITHPNVCRVYDVGEAAGEAFISMEFVDGENLRSLLRRIGRLPREKMIDITRQLCAGLSWAHLQGVLHRDLKPANIMIDGHGRVRITDFGIAILNDKSAASQTPAGTLAYMAPELLAGGPASTRSDFYALGLVMYEMITGICPSADRQTSRARHAAPDPPSKILPDVDPAIERVILRCLQTDLQERPQSALEIAAALPGGDRLVAAIAAGETPSPEIVAAAGGEGRLRPKAAIGICALATVCLAAVILLADRTLLLSGRTLVKSPDVLEDRAREVVRQLGGDPDGPRARSGFAFVQSVTGGHDPSAEAGSNAGGSGPPKPGAAVFEYALGGTGVNSPPVAEPLGGVSSEAAAQTAVRLDPSGNLLSYQDESRQPLRGQPAAREPDWALPATLAGIRWDRLRPVNPDAAPPVFADAVCAWEGPGGPDADPNVHVEAAARSGRILYYRVERPAASNQPAPKRFRSPIGPRPLLAASISLVLFLIVLAGGVVLARRNLRLGRGDWRGARRVGLFMFGLELVICAIDHTAASDLLSEVKQLFAVLQVSLFSGVSMGVLYMGLEPYVRRLWPQSIVTWSRLVSGRLSDPLIGHDLLIGVAFGIGIVLLQQINALFLPGYRVLPQLLQPGNEWILGRLAGPQYTFEVLARGLRTAVIDGTTFLMLMLLLRLLLKSPARAGIVFALVGTAICALASPFLTLFTCLTCATIVAGFSVLLDRFGLLATVTGLMTTRLLLANPLTADTRAWCAGNTALVVLGTLVLLGFGLYVTLKRSPAGHGLLVSR